MFEKKLDEGVFGDGGGTREGQSPKRGKSWVRVGVDKMMKNRVLHNRKNGRFGTAIQKNELGLQTVDSVFDIY